MTSFFKIIVLLPNRPSVPRCYQMQVNGLDFGRQGDAPIVYFGRSLTSRISSSSITPVTSRQLRFGLPAGHGADIPIHVSVGGLDSNLDTSFSYTPPAVTALAYVSGYHGANITLQLTGTNFGSCCYQQRVSGVSQVRLLNCQCFLAL